MDESQSRQHADLYEHSNAPRKSTPVFARRAGSNLTAVMKLMFLRRVDAGLKRGISIRETTKRCGMGKNAYWNYLRQESEGRLEPKPKFGRQRKLDRSSKEVLYDINDEARGTLTFQEMAQAFRERSGMKISAATLHREFHRTCWRFQPHRESPLLSDQHMENRRLWALRNLNNCWGDDNTVWVDIDETMLHLYQNKGKRKLSPRDISRGVGGHTGRIPRRKSNKPPKLHVLCAIAKPNRKRKFDGRVGLWAFANEELTRRSSKNRPAGVPELRPIASVDSEVWERYMLKEVYPALQMKVGQWAKKIIIQADNATPHKASIQRLNVHGASCVPPIEIIKQPSQSPDTNLLDLCFFSSPKSRIAKYRSLTDLLQLREKAREVYATWHSEAKLVKLWALKTAVMRRIFAYDGENQFKMPHNVLAGVPTRIPSNCAVAKR